VLDVDLLRTFVAITESGSFTAAAEIVGRTQSAVSLQVRKLEDQVGHALFLRDPHGIAPTPHGELLLAHARRILRAHDEALIAFDRHGRPASHWRIGISADYGQALLPRVLAAVEATRPGTMLDFVCGPSSDIAGQVLEGRVDLAFVGEGEGLGHGPVVHRERCVWATGGEEHRRDPPPLALPPRECLYRRWACDRLDAVGRRHRILYTSYSIGGIQAAVRGGRAVTVVSESALVPGMRELTEAEGFPALPDVVVRMVRCLAKDDTLLRDLEEELALRLSLAEAL
jgi:DNA-binding transcriptional LysR family regulator